ncbi:hydroxymethylglutaryl-CoA synthase family protein [Sandaracinus amylolyticus]|uniref:hydroxymethylglutaryl-CoA synthase family protein n=1 Tax=Sandaracinus amylolyticus TaxID=927083 RepID=UPI001F1FC64B|nr:hydroxymethylglutaryl-CoA synthase [Sandaracinus amylolyticus]UJR84167.1 Hypothetical protein I5071_62380 [Sandaracinus amylolyticus]
MRRTFGIDAYSLYVPRLYVDLTQEWCAVRAPQLGIGSPDLLRGKLVAGIGIRKMAVADGHEDAATMAAMAAKQLIDATGIDPSDIELLSVGTETTVDQSKSIAAYVLGMLERHYGKSLRHVGTPQVQFACIGATYALESAVNHLRAGENTRPYAIVIATDISKYRLRSPGEYTQGAGAVAMLVSESPRLLALDPGVVGTATRDARDFFRPNWSRTATVDGKHSIDVYLSCLEDALREHLDRAGARRGLEPGIASVRQLLAEFDSFLFHVPFPRMAEYAAARVFRLMWEGSESHGERMRELAAGLAPDDTRELEKRLMKTDFFRAHFERTVAPSLELPGEIGNVYSASLYLAFASMTDAARRDGVDLTGRRVLLCSYGSGASAKVFSGTVGPEWKRVAARHYGTELRPVSEGGRRIAISVAEYERLHEHEEVVASAEAANGAGEEIVLVGPPPSVHPPRDEFVLQRLGRLSTPELTDHGYRYYQYLSNDGAGEQEVA